MCKADILGEASPATQKELSSSFALFLLIMLLIAALFTSYFLQQRKIQAVHETVLSIFAGTCLGCSVVQQFGECIYLKGEGEYMYCTIWS
jgi:solute carrier family 9 (sodium/hydrogen exchanger), member 6/7